MHYLRHTFVYKMLVVVLISFLLLILNSEAASNCTTPNGEAANCISIYSCESFLSVIKNANNETKDFMRQSECGCFMVCCGTATTFIKKATTVKPASKSWRPLASRKICGYQHTDDRFYNKQETAIDEFPWLVQLRHKDIDDGRIIDKCAGSLINRRYVLTTAHCTISKQSTIYDIRLGEYDTLNDTDCAENPDYPDCSDPVIDAGIETVIRHQHYNKRTKQNDIALIRMNRNVAFSDYIRPICLPSYGYKNATEGDNITLSGWGHTEFGGETSRLKKRIVNRVVSVEECKKFYANNRITIDKHFLCASESALNSTCQGDSGGPTMTKINFQWQQDGIVAYGKACGIDGAISVNINVAEYMDWIIENIKPF